VDRLAALNQAEQDLAKLEAQYQALGADYGGPVSARAKSWAMGGNNPDIIGLETAITAATPNLARGVFREVGVLTDQDVKRYSSLFPMPTDTQAVRNQKFKQLKARIAEGKKETMDMLRKSGRDLSGFEENGVGTGGPTVLNQSPPKARKYNPATGRIE
jgi:hypothetical protein